MNSLGQLPFLSKPCSKHPDLFKGAYVLGWALFVFYYAITNPYYYWDVIGYVASVYELIGFSEEALRDATYEDVRNAVPPHIFSELTGETLSHNYRSTVYEDASALQQQIPFYKIRYGYIWITYVLGQLIGSFSQATILISAASGFLIVLISGILFWNARSVIVFLSVPPAVVFGGETLTLSKISQPDAIAACAAVFLCALIVVRRHITATFLIALLPLFRTDYLIFALAAGFILFLRGNSRLAVLSASLALLTYFAANHFAENYGYAVIFNFTLIDRWNSPYPLLMPISDNVRDYVDAYIRGLRKLVDTSEIYLYPVIVAVVVFFTSAQNRYQNRFFIIYFSCLFFVSMHFLFFPAAFLRHYFILPWASLMYLAEAFALHRHPAHRASNASDLSPRKFTGENR